VLDRAGRRREQSCQHARGEQDRRMEAHAHAHRRTVAALSTRKRPTARRRAAPCGTSSRPPSRRRCCSSIANILYYDIDTPLKRCVEAQLQLVRHCRAIHARVGA
jgi:hypothetical protein